MMRLLKGILEGLAVLLAWCVCVEIILLFIDPSPGTTWLSATVVVAVGFWFCHTGRLRRLFRPVG
jgi:hypothetical protein